MTTIPAIVPPLPREKTYNRNLAPGAAFAWLSAGWRDLWATPGISLFYGIGVFVASLIIVIGLFRLELDYILFPALAGFMVLGPALAVGLYEKSRRLTAGESVMFGEILFVKSRAGAQILFIGAILCLLMLTWMRAAVIIYALFFGLTPFPGLEHIAPMLFTTPLGWAMLLVGGAVGGLFAAFSFAISVFSIPMLLDENVDAFTAMGTSMALVWNNLAVMIAWGVIVLTLFVLSLITGTLGLVLVFPLVGHATWHAYKAIRTPA
jgi:uncharacterized membrane protein